MLTFMTTGESHGPQLTAVADGLPAGLHVDIQELNFQLARRQKGFGRGGRMEIEKDEASIVSGVRNGVTLGGPVTLVIKNRDWANWSEIMDPIKPPPEDLGERQARLLDDTSRPRPGHADLAGGIKWNHHDLRNVLERASARETAARVALGALTRQFLERFGVRFASHVLQIGSAALTEQPELIDLEDLARKAEESEVRCVDPVTSERMIAEIKAARKRRDSLGGRVEVIVRGLPVGLGSCSQWYQRLDGRLAGALMSIQSVKSVHIGPDPAVPGLPGSQVHDQIYYDPDGDPVKKKFYRKTNNAGGIEGGMTNGEDVIVQVANKPISTLNRPLRTIDVRSKEPAEAIVERADHCVVPALAVICEAAVSLVLADVFLDKFGGDNMAETERHFEEYLKADY
ncbi:MAG: chorismate synthase [bacterium]|nr:chorismate synthase [bacterium]